MNLHALWDTGLVELEEGTAKEVPERLDDAVSDDDRKLWRDGTPEQWALESLAVVRTRVYRLPVSSEINNAHTIYEVVKAKSTNRINNFNMGFIHSQAGGTRCEVTDLVIVD